MQKFKSVENLINQLKPEKPVYCIRKCSVTTASKFFQKNFPGDILYAVKTNPHPVVIQTLISSGINQFDVASIEEIKQIKKFSNTAKCSYMHTVKSPESIKEAYFKYDIKKYLTPLCKPRQQCYYRLLPILMAVKTNCCCYETHTYN